MEFFRYSGGALKTGGVPLSRIADQVGTPVYVYSAEALLRPLHELQRGLRGLDVLICFAMKSNSNLSILKLLSQEGAGIDVVSGGELFRAKRADVSSSRIVFSGVGKTEHEIREALLQKIYSFNVESIPELELINRVAEKMSTQAPVALRFNPDVDAKTHPYISTGLRKNKFGLERREILEIIRKSTCFRAIRFRGLSIHIGSQLLDLAPLEDAVTRLKELACVLDRSFPQPLEFLDIGGGVGITYRKERSPSIEKYCRLIRKHFGASSRKSGPERRILLEPGRMLSGNAGVLVSRVLYRKRRGNKDFLVIDAGMNDLVRPALYGSYHEIVSLKRSGPRPKLRLADVVGPICESSDSFATSRKLPVDLDQGDLVAILSAGAYGFSMASNYNTRPRPAEVLVQNGKPRLIRERESYEDLIEGELI